MVLAGFLMAAAGMVLLPSAAAFGLAGLLPAMVLLYTGINWQRSPFQALVADVVPSRHRSFATGSVTFQMCVGAIVFLMLGRLFGMQPAFLIAAATVLAITGAFALTLREPAASRAAANRSRPSGRWPMRRCPRCGGRSPASARSSWRHCCCS